MKKIYGNERTIPYRPQLKQFFGSANAAILYAQLEFWAVKSKGEAFYKFNAPCGHDLYRAGDSLQEELCFNRRELENAMSRICKQYASKSEYENSSDKFESMPYCSYFNKVEHVKYYFRNHEVCDYINEVDSDDLPIYEDGRSTICASTGTHNVHRVDAHNVHPILILYKRLQQKITQEQNHCVSITKSDAVACSNNSDNVSFESIAKSDTFACSDNSRSASNDTLAHGNHMAARVSEKMYVPTEAKADPRPDAPPRATDPRHAELEKMFEEFRIAYRKANGNVGGFQVEFDHLKKKHPKKWHEIIPTLLEKFNDQLEQRRLQKLEEGFTPQLPMLKRYVNEQMWDRHYYTSQGIPTSAAPKLHYTPSLPQFTEDQLK